MFNLGSGIDVVESPREVEANGLAKLKTATDDWVGLATSTRMPESLGLVPVYQASTARSIQRGFDQRSVQILRQLTRLAALEPNDVTVGVVVRLSRLRRGVTERDLRTLQLRNQIFQTVVADSRAPGHSGA